MNSPGQESARQKAPPQPIELLRRRLLGQFLTGASAIVIVRAVWWHDMGSNS